MFDLARHDWVVSSVQTHYQRCNYEHQSRGALLPEIGGPQHWPPPCRPREVGALQIHRAYGANLPRQPALSVLHEQHVEGLGNQLLLLPARLMREVAQLLEC